MAEKREETDLGAAMRCVVFAMGIIISLGAYGVLQERIMSEPYGDEYFKVSVFLVLCNRLAAIVFAVIMVAVKQESYVATVPIWKYLAVSLSNVSATWCQYEALQPKTRNPKNPRP